MARYCQSVSCNWIAVACALASLQCGSSRVVTAQIEDVKENETGEEPIFEVDLTMANGSLRASQPAIDVAFTHTGDFLIVGRRVYRTSNWELAATRIPSGEFLTTAWPNRVVCYDFDSKTINVSDLSSRNGELAVISMPVELMRPARICAARDEPCLFLLERWADAFRVRRVNLEDGTTDVYPLLPMGFNKAPIFNFSLMDHDRYIVILCRSAVYLFDRKESEWLTSPDLEDAILRLNVREHPSSHRIARIHWVHGANNGPEFFASTRGSTNLECRIDRDSMKISFGFLGEFDLETIEVSSVPDARREKPGFRYRPTVDDSRHYQIASINDDRWWILQCHHYMLRVQNTASVAVVDRESGRELVSFDARRGSMNRIPFAFCDHAGLVAVIDPNGVLRVWDVPTIERIAHRLEREEIAREAERTRRRAETIKRIQREQAGRQMIDLMFDGTYTVVELGSQWTFSRVAFIDRAVDGSLALIRRVKEVCAGQKMSG